MKLLAALWLAFRKAVGIAWRKLEDCPHPPERRRLDHGCGGQPAWDIQCMDCGEWLLLWDPLHGRPAGPISGGS